MATRAELKEQKEKTSNALIQAAIQLCAEEGYASLSLRSVARKAGIAPTSFYRHFRDLDELGVAIVDEAKTVLEKCIVQARKKIPASNISKDSSPEQILQSIESIVIPFVETFMEFLEQNNPLLYLFFQERTGSSESMRIAISESINSISELLSQDLTLISGKFTDGSDKSIFIAESMITIVSYNGIVMLLSQELERREINEQLIKKLNLFLLGNSIYEQIIQGNKDE